METGPSPKREGIKWFVIRVSDLRYPTCTWMLQQRGQLTPVGGVAPASSDVAMSTSLCTLPLNANKLGCLICSSYSGLLTEADYPWLGYLLEGYRPHRARYLRGYYAVQPVIHVLDGDVLHHRQIWLPDVVSQDSAKGKRVSSGADYTVWMPNVD